MKPIIITLCVSSLFTNLSMHTIADKQERISDKTESVIKTIENLEETELSLQEIKPLGNVEGKHTYDL